MKFKLLHYFIFFKVTKIIFVTQDFDDKNPRDCLSRGFSILF